MNIITALVSGLLFGAGLALGGMTNPATVLGFLDVMGVWNPSLAFVMGGALLVSTSAYMFVWRPTTELLGESLDLPTSSRIDRRLLTGSALFGIGWGLAGFCPGPALASLSTGSGSVFLFVASMVTGVLLFRFALSGATAVADSAAVRE